MEIGSHKTKLGQDIISKSGLAVLIILFLNCSSAKPFQLTDASPRYREFQGSDLDPNNRKPKSIELSNNQLYDDFILKANKSLSTLEFAENVINQADTKKSSGTAIQAEMNAAGYLSEDLPPILSNLPSLQKRNMELIDSSPNDFDGPSLGRVSNELARIEEKLAIYLPRAEKIFQGIRNLRADSSNYSNARETTEIVETIQETKADPTLDKPEVSEIIKPEPEQKPVTPKKSSKIQISKLAKKKKVTGSAKDLFKEEIRNVEENLSEDEKQENEYTEKIRSGLVQVFKWEYYKKPKALEKLLLTYPIPRVRSAAALALGRLKTGRTALQQAIDKDGYQVRPSAFKALSELGDKKSLPYFISGTKAEEIEVIAASYEGLGKTKDPAGREMIISDGLNSEYVLVVAASLRGLAYNKIPADVSLIEKFLKSAEEVEIKEAAIEALSLHGSRESLRILEENVKTQPELASKILDAIGKNNSLSATFSLIRLNENIEDEKLSSKIGEHLLRKKAFGKYALIIVEDDFLRSEPNERSTPLSYVKTKEVGLVIGESKKEFAVRIGDDIITDRYVQLRIESTLPGSRNPFISGWIFYPKIEIIEVKKLGETDDGKYSNLKTGKHQNIFNPDKKNKIEGEKN